jgi:3-oxoacyl-[acyl-carrier protein] reductase
MRLNGKTALVTGSSRGIGRAIVLAVAREGANAVVCYREQAEAAGEVVAAIKAEGGRATAVALAVTSRESIRAALEEVKSKFGPINILVNNAGINRPEDFDKITDEDWDDVLEINLTGAFRVTQEALPYLAEGGSIINISSVSGQYGGPRTSHYAVSKAGLIALTQNLAIFCAKRGIRVNTISPGLIASEMAQAAKGLPIMERILLGRMGTPEEVGDAAVFLASDESSYITAQVLNVNGGLYF